MPVAESPSRCLDAELLGRRACGPDAYVLELRLPEPLAPAAPGRFAMLSPADGSGPCIPRPFSLYDQPAPDRVTFLVQVLGKGTRALVALQPGALVTCTLPLGNGFTVAPPQEEVAMVAGGVGSAPFLLYARRRAAAAQGADDGGSADGGGAAATHFLFGARSGERLYDRAAFDGIALRTVLATDDGSLGYAGNVVRCLEAELDAGRIGADARFVACGPEGLLHGFAEFARARGLRAELSLETYMGCGFGVCNACPVPTAPDGPLGAWPWARTCEAGPVFELPAIRF